MLTEHPFTGIGAGAFPLGVEERLGGQHAAHNVFIAAGAETGIVGLMLLVSTLACAVVPALRSGRRQVGPNVLLFMVLMVGALLVNVQVSKVFWMVMAVLSIASLKVKAEESQKVPGARQFRITGESTSGAPAQ